MDGLSRFCCLNSRCPDFGRRDAGNLTVTGRLGKSRQFRLLYCRTCHDRFSERKGTPLYRAHLPEDKVSSILEHIHEGCGVLKTARLVKVHPDTVSRYSRAAGDHSRAAPGQRGSRWNRRPFRYAGCAARFAVGRDVASGVAGTRLYPQRNARDEPAHQDAKSPNYSSTRTREVVRR